MVFNCVVKLPHFMQKSQCNNSGIWEGKIKSYLGKVCIFLPTLFYKNHRNINYVVMKNMINTSGKKTHTLVKENTPWCHKIRQECGFTQKVTFFCISLCILPRCCANIGREVRLMLPNTYQEIYDTHT